MSKVIVTRPNHDLTTNYLFFWTQTALDLTQTVDLKGTRANKQVFTSVVNKIKPTFILINGHGNSNSVFGHDDSVLIEVGSNEAILKGAITYSRSCKSAEILGQKAIESGCKAFIGYNEDFVFLIENDKITKPLTDKTARYFLEASNQIVVSLLKGHTAGDSNRRSREMFRRTIQKLSTSAASREEAEMIPYLFWDFTHQVCIGDQEASLA